MKQTLRKTVGLISLSALIWLISFNTYAINAIIGSGFSTGWTNPGNITYPFSGSAGNSRIATFASNNSGFRYFRLIRGWTGTGCLDGNNTEYGPAGNVDVQITNFGTVPALGYTNGFGAWFVNDNGGTGRNYIIKTENPCTSNRFTMFYVQGAVQTVSSVTRSPSGTVYPGQSITVTATLSAALSAGQGAYLRYTTNGNYSNASILPMSLVSGSNYAATIPSVPANASVSYYVFTSGSGLTISNTDADFYTINLNNNSGNHYTLTVASAWVTAQAGNYNTGSTWVGGSVPVANQPVTIAHAITSDVALSVPSLTINTGQSLSLGANNLTVAASGSLTITGTLNAGSATVSIGAGGTFTNNGTFTASTSTVSFAGAGTLGGSSATTFNNLTLNTGELTVNTNPTVNGTLTINGGNFSSGATITYGSSSTLQYNVSYTAFREWTATTTGAAGAGRPQNITVAATRTLTLPASSTRAIGNGGTLTINGGFDGSNSTLTLGAGSSVVNNGTFTASTSTVQFTGTGSVGGTAATTFNNLTIGSGAVTFSQNPTINGTFDLGGATFTGVTFTYGTSSTLRYSATMSPGLEWTATTAGTAGTGRPQNVTIASGQTVDMGSLTRGLGTSGTLLISGTLNANASTINIGAGGTFTNNSTFTTGTSTVSFAGAGTLGGSSATTFNNLTLNTGELTVNTNPTVNGTLTINGGNFSSGATITYGSSSTLQYNVSYTAFREWTANTDDITGSGRPNNVTLSNGTTLTLPAETRSLRGNLTICSTCSLTFAASGDLMLRGNWVNNHTGSNINFGSGQGRAVWFRGISGTQTISKASGTQSFSYLLLNNTGTVQLLSPINLTATAAEPLQFNTVGTLDLNGQTLTMSGTGGGITVNGNYAVNSTVAGGTIAIAGTKTSTVSNNTLTLGSNVNFSISSGITFTQNFNLNTAGTLTLAANAVHSVSDRTLTLNNATLSIGSGAGIQTTTTSTVSLQNYSSFAYSSANFSSANLGTLVLNNTGVTTLSRNLTLTSGLTLTAGDLSVTNGNTLTFGTSATWPTETTTRKIIGRTAMTARTVGTGSLNFMGVSLASGVDNLGTVTITRTTGADGRITANGSSGLDVSWVVDAQNQPLNGRSVTFSWLSTFDNSRNMNNMQIWRRISPTDPWLPVSSFTNVSSSDPRSITMTTNHFSDWTMTDDNNVLPVTFGKLDARRIAEVNQVSFTTVYEQNTSHFLIESSADGKEFEVTGRLEANGKSTAATAYSYSDKSGTADSYYRIRAIDFDGHETISPIVRVMKSERLSMIDLTLAPNPTANNFELTVTAPSTGLAEVSIIDAKGQVVAVKNLNLKAGLNILKSAQLHDGYLQAGIYILKVQDELGGANMVRLIKQ